MRTLRRLSVTIAATALLGASPSPAAADPMPLATWIVTYDSAPSPYQIDVLRGVTDAVHGFSEVPAYYHSPLLGAIFMELKL